MTDAAATERGGVSVEVRGLRKSFAGQPVLKGVDFKVEHRATAAEVADVR